MRVWDFIYARNILDRHPFRVREVDKEDVPYRLFTNYEAAENSAVHTYCPVVDMWDGKKWVDMEFKKWSGSWREKNESRDAGGAVDEGEAEPVDSPRVG